jgi:hypothetical protein
MVRVRRQRATAPGAKNQERRATVSPLSSDLAWFLVTLGLLVLIAASAVLRGEFS